MAFNPYRGRTKYSAVKTYSELCQRKFDSKAEARRGEELYLLQQAGVITDLEYQITFVLSHKPSIKIKVDFAYKVDGKMVYEDAKGMLTREFRVKMAWLEQSQGIHIDIVKP